MSGAGEVDEDDQTSVLGEKAGKIAIEVAKMEEVQEQRAPKVCCSRG